MSNPSIASGILQFQEQGFTVLPELFSSAELTKLQDSIDDRLDRIARGFLTPFETSCPNDLFEQRLESIAKKDHAYATALMYSLLADAQREPLIASLSDHSKLRGWVEQLIAPARVTGHSIRVRANVPSLPSTRSRWHQDVADLTITTGKCHTVRLACWIPLVDATAENGTLQIRPGRLDRPTQHERDERGTFHIPEDRLPDAESITVPVDAGDVLMLDRFVPHRALPNLIGSIRWNLVIWFKGEVPAG